MVLNDGTVQLSSLGKYGAQLSPLFLIHMLYVSVSIWACFRVCSQPAMRGAPPEVRLGWHLFKKCCHTEQSGLKQCYTVTALHPYSTEIEKKIELIGTLDNEHYCKVLHRTQYLLADLFMSTPLFSICFSSLLLLSCPSSFLPSLLSCPSSFLPSPGHMGQIFLNGFFLLKGSVPCHSHMCTCSKGLSGLGLCKAPWENVNSTTWN